jgi:hypothetical protein
MTSDLRECQCQIESPRGVNPWPAVRVMFDLAGHPDWRIREWVAYRNIYWWESAGDPSESSLLRRSWQDLRRALRADGHETVAETARQMGLERPPEGRRLRMPYDRLDVVLQADHEVVWRAREAYRAGVLAQRPVAERILGVAGPRFGALPPEMFEDPVCAVRAAATMCLDPLTALPEVLSRLDNDPCHEVGTARDASFGPPGRLLSPQEWARRNGCQPDPTLDPERDDPALWHGTWHPHHRNLWVYVPSGVEPAVVAGRRASLPELVTRPDGSHWLKWGRPETVMGAFGLPRACECAKGHATLLCYFNYDEWHPEYSLLCPPCWRSRRNRAMIEAVGAVWNGTHWCHPDASVGLSDPQPGDSIMLPPGLPEDRLIVANAPLAYRRPQL